MSDPLLDARGVVIEPGDTVIYGFGVGRSIAMAEAVVLGDIPFHEVTPSTSKVSLTLSGRVRLRVVRRSYSSGERPIVSIAPDRLVVLKESDGPGTTPSLPGSPLPTQDELARVNLERSMECYTARLRATEAPDWWQDDLASYHVYCAGTLAKLRRKLEALDDNRKDDRDG